MSRRPNPVHTAANAVPPLEGTELGGVLDDLAGIHAGIDLIRDGIRLLAHDQLTLDQTQTVIAALAGSPDTDAVTAIALLVQRLATADTNPCLRALLLHAQKDAQQLGEQTAFALTDPDLHQHASETAAVINGA